MSRRAYTVSVPGEEYWREVDYMGIASGRDTDKVKDTELTAVKSELVDAPYVDEFPLVLECKVVKVVKIGLHTEFIGEILDVKADKDVLTDGAPDTQKIRPLLFGTGDRGYHTVESGSETPSPSGGPRHPSASNLQLHVPSTPVVI